MAALRCSVKFLLYWHSYLQLLTQAILWGNLAAAQGNSNVTFFCPCLDRTGTRFSLLTHFHALTSTTGAQLHASVRQAARDRGYQLSAYYFNPGNGFNVREAADFIEDEMRAGTAGIVASINSGQLIASLSAANAAGIPIYLVEGGDPDLVASLQKREPFMGGPVRASIRYIGPNEAALATQLAATLISRGVNHLECIVTDVDDMRWPSRCRLVQRAFFEAALSAEVNPVLQDIAATVQQILLHYPGLHVAILVEDVTTYKEVNASLPPSASVSVVVYETSVGILDDISADKPVLAVDFCAYTQGYLALALASVEHHTGQMVTSDIETAVTIYGQGAQPVTEEVMRREVCRAAGNPVCGDPGVLPVTPSGCACFNRSDVSFRVIGAVPKRLLTSYHLYQGMVDAERDLPGSTFEWKMYDNLELIDQLAEYGQVANGSSYHGAISLEAFAGDSSPALLSAMRSVGESRKPLYLGYLQAPAASTQAFLDRFKARVFVGSSALYSGQYVAYLARQLQGRHMLVHHNVVYLASVWAWVRSLVTAYLGGDYAYPPNIWDFPPGMHGSPVNRTGAWALFTNPLTNQTAQVMNGVDLFLGAAFLQPLHDRLAGEFPGPAPSDTLVTIAFSNFFSSATLPMLKNLTSVEQPERPPVRLITYKCSDVEFSALLRWNLTANEELVLGCVDEQMYVSTYLLATIAALEQQTGERVVGEVRTDRLLRYDKLPLNYARRAACEHANSQKGFLKGQLGVFYPLCDIRQGCVDASAPSDAVACSGHGDCQFPKQAPAGTTSWSQGTCLCHYGWTGPFCSVHLDMVADARGDWRHILPAVLLSLGFVLLVAVLFLVARSARRVRASSRYDGNMGKALLKSMPVKDEEASVAVVVMDVDGLATLLAWDAATTKKALEVFQAVVRSQLHHYGGHELCGTDGSFTLSFPDPIEALGMAVDLQHGLMFPRFLLDEIPTGPFALLKQRRLSMGDALSDWPPSLIKHECGREERCPATGGMLYRGLRVRMGIHVGPPYKRQGSSEGKNVYKGEVVDFAAAICGLTSGGQVLMSMQAWRSLGVHVTSTVCHHMGMHEVAEGLPPIHLMQVLPEELAKRAPFPPLKSVRQLGASFFDAPAAECYAAGKHPTEPVVIAFVYVASAKILRKTPGFRKGVDLLVAFVQRRLSEFEAYEVEEKDGNFLLAFRSAAKAVQFAEMVQREAMGLPWSSKLLSEEQAAEVVKPGIPDGEGGMTKEVLVFRGLRLQIGMCMDVPSDCQPHMTTGRAAYFGPVVNRAARIAATAAPGQTLVNEACYASAKGNCGPVLFTELGKFELKGVKEPMHLYQVSSHEMSVRLFPRTLKLAKVTEPIVAFEVTSPVAVIVEDSVADGLRLPAHLVASFSPNAKTTRETVSMQVTRSQGLETLSGMARAPQRAGRRENRISRLLSLAARGTSHEDSATVVMPGRAAHRARTRPSDEIRPRGRPSDDLRSHGRPSDESTRVSIDELVYEDMSYDALFKLAVKQHKELKELKALPVPVAAV